GQSRPPPPSSRQSSGPPGSRPASRTWRLSGPPRDGLPRKDEPGAKRVSGSSVRISTTTSPVMPCALTTRPTTRSIRPLLVGVHHVDTDAAAADTGDQRAHRGRGAATTPDDLAEIDGPHRHLDRPSSTTGHHVDPHN